MILVLDDVANIWKPLDFCVKIDNSFSEDESFYHQSYYNHLLVAYEAIATLDFYCQLGSLYSEFLDMEENWLRVIRCSK